MVTTVKTAISIDKALFEQAEILAQELNVSRSHLFVLAVENFIKHHQSQILLDKINEAYSDQPDPVEQNRIRQMRKSHRSLVEGEW